MAEQATTLPEFNPSGDPIIAEIKRRTESLLQYVSENINAGFRKDQALILYESAAMWAVKAAVTNNAPQQPAST